MPFTGHDVRSCACPACIGIRARSARQARQRRWANAPELPPATADTWVSRADDGTPRPIKVVDMEDGHLVRWIQWARKKFQVDRDFVGSAAELDAAIKATWVTGPAIFAEAERRGLTNLSARLGDIDAIARLVEENRRLKAQVKQLGAKPAKVQQVGNQLWLDTDTPMDGERLITLVDDGE